MTPAPGKRGRSWDWDEVKSRLANARLEDALELSPARARELMARRARALSLPARRFDDERGAEFLVFSLAKERYAIEARFVREVAKLIDLTPVPGTPEFLAGVTNLRGEILVVVDLRRFLGLSQSGLADLSRLIVLGTDCAEFGILADEAHSVSSIDDDSLMEPPGSVTGIGREFLKGVTKDMLIVLDGHGLLRAPRLFAAAPGAQKT